MSERRDLFAAKVVPGSDQLRKDSGDERVLSWPYALISECCITFQVSSIFLENRTQYSYALNY